MGGKSIALTENNGSDQRTEAWIRELLLLPENRGIQRELATESNVSRSAITQALNRGVQSVLSRAVVKIINRMNERQRAFDETKQRLESFQQTLH
ncbi:MAG: hypothetical protein ABI876_11470 [Bacteroidota bacterium]